MNSRVGQMELSYIRTVLEKARSMEKNHREIVHMEVGEPDFNSPRPLIEAAMQALLDGYTHYGPDEGLEELRVYVADTINREKGLFLDPKRNVIITSGASEAIFASMVGLAGPGSSVLIPEPAFGNYYNCCLCSGADPVTVPLKLGERCELDFEALEKAVGATTTMIVINNPHNPTGAVFKARDIEQLAEFVREKDLIIITDEIYEDIYYDNEKPLSVASVRDMADRTVLIGGFSKSYALTGWRVGYVAAPEHLYEPIQKVHQYAVTCAATFSQVAIANALEKSRGEKLRMIEEFTRRRNYLTQRLGRIKGLSFVWPQGAFYAFVDISRSGFSSLEFSEKILEEKGLALVPGSIFGPTGEGYVRLSYAAAMEEVEKGLDLLESFIADYAG